MNVFCLGPEDINGLWHAFAHHLDRFERECETDFAEDLKRDLIEGRKQLWGLQDGPKITGIVLTRIAECPNGPVCEIYAACGEAHGRIHEVLTTIERWAQSINCKRMRVLGRKGWARVLDYRQTGIILEKEF